MIILKFIILKMLTIAVRLNDNQSFAFNLVNAFHFNLAAGSKFTKYNGTRNLGIKNG